MMKNSYMQKKEEVVRNWYVIDAEGVSLGRVAAKVANVLRGKHKPTYTPNVDCGDYIIIVNAEKVSLSGDAEHKKTYYNASGWARGIRARSSGTMIREYPEEMVRRAVHGMLPKGRLGRKIESKLFVYVGSEHKHEAQKPEPLTLKF